MPSGNGPLALSPRRTQARYFDVGIAEEHASSFCLWAWPRRDFSPFCTIYSTFFQRAYDMAIHDMAIKT
jgi:1-deoxy-D-xylulose-5-phosphate synthase